ncbi:MAG TPA: hypothetical protein VGN13_12540 [Solirubrobacteraceae bacterium]
MTFDELLACRTLGDFAPRLATAREQLFTERIQARERKEARKQEARERKHARREANATVFCGKVRYLSEGDALEGLAHAHAAVQLRVYECRACGGWHVTSKAHPRWAKTGRNGERGQ